MIDLERPDELEVKIKLNWDDLPDETQLIYNMYKAGSIDFLLYTVISDVKSGTYNIDDRVTQDLLENVIQTVSTIYEAMNGVNSNVLGIIDVMDEQNDNYIKIKESVDEKLAMISKLPDIDKKVVEKIEIKDRVNELNDIIVQPIQELEFNGAESDGAVTMSLEEMDDMFL